MSEGKFLTGKTALVTCSSRGIGNGIASGLAEAGASLILCSRDSCAGSLADACTQIQDQHQTVARGVACDLETEAGVDTLLSFVMSETGGRGTDIFVSNAPHPLNPATTSGIDRRSMATSQFSVLSAPLLLSDALAPAMASRKWGRIFYISSCYAMRPTERFFISSYLRPALTNLAVLTTQRFGIFNVSALTLLLGYFETSLTQAMDPNTPAIARALALSPAKPHLPMPNQLGSIVRDLCQDHFRLISGTSILVDYGYTGSDI